MNTRKLGGIVLALALVVLLSAFSYPAQKREPWPVVHPAETCQQLHAVGDGDCSGDDGFAQVAVSFQKPDGITKLPNQSVIVCLGLYHTNLQDEEQDMSQPRWMASCRWTSLVDMGPGIYSEQYGEFANFNVSDWPSGFYDVFITAPGATTVNTKHCVPSLQAVTGGNVEGKPCDDVYEGGGDGNNAAETIVQDASGSWNVAY